jgi:hypothetical protein
LNLERSTNNLSKRLEVLDSPANGGNGNSKSSNGIDISDDDGYYLAIGSEPPRFAYYRHYRIKNSKDEWRKQSLEAAYDSITQYELDFSLKRKLRKSPAERYDQKRRSGLYHSSTSCSLGECVPECRYYPKYGRIEDSEVIQEHKEIVEYHRQRNDIMDIDVSTIDNKADYLEFLKMWNNL